MTEPEPPINNIMFDQRGQQVQQQTNIAGNLYTGDQAYDVRGLANPYLGLKAFTYADRALYAGRDAEITAALRLLTAPGNERSLLFITGASGSGKSSFVQAGLLPALKSHYQAQNFAVEHAIFRPGEKPLAGLAGTLRTLKVAAAGIFAPVAPASMPMPIELANPNQISLLIIDQFEELFNQSEAPQRAALFKWLTELLPFPESRLHIIATLRVDYLPELFVHPILYEQAKAGIDLRAMNIAQLELAIQRPLQAQHPGTEKRWQTALLQRLAGDTAEDAAYLPLLQVTLEAIWRGGFLTVDYYTSLTDAISRRADAIFTHTSDAAGNPSPRLPDEQTAMLQIFLDLVDVSPDGDQRRDVRRTRHLVDLTRGQRDIEKLVDELATARLLSTGEKSLDSSNQPTQTVDIIHESLIRNWARLAQAIQTQREQLRQRRRFELRLADWLSHTQSTDFLLTGVYLAEAEALHRQNDVALQPLMAKAYLAQSIGQRNSLQQAEIERQRVEIERQRTLVVEQAKRAEAEAERAEAETNRARTFRWAALITTILLLLALAAAGWATKREGDARTSAAIAEANAQDARARALVAQAQALQQQANLLPVSMLLAIEAQKTNPSAEAEDLLRQGLTLLPKVLFDAPETGKVTQVAFSTDGAWVATADESGAVQIRNALTGTQVRVIQQATIIRSLAFNPIDPQQLATAGYAGQACVWYVTTGKPVFPCISHSTQINKVLFSPDGKWLATATLDGQACLWAATTGQPGDCMRHGYNISDIAFSPDSQWLASADDSGNIQIWGIDAAKQIASGNHSPKVLALAFNHDGQLATAGSDGTARLWAIDATTTTLRELAVFHHNGIVNDLAFNPIDNTLATVSDDKTVRLWDVATSAETWRMYHADLAKVVTFSPNGNWLATASVDHTACVWDAATGQELARLVHDNEVRTVVFSPNGQQIATGSTDRTTKVWALPALERSRVQQPSHIWTLAYHPTLQQFATTSDNGFSVTLWDTLTGDPIDRLPPNRATATALAFSRDGQWLATGRDDNSTLVWRLTDKEAHSYSYGGEVRAVAFSPDGECLASGGVNQVVQVRPLGDDCKPASIPYTDTVTAVTYSATGQWLATASRAGLAQVMQVATGTLITFSHGGAPILAVAISPNEQLLATAGVDRSVHLWQIASGQPMTVTLPHGREVRTVAFSPDGQWLATGSADGTARVWAVTTGQEVARLQQNRAIDAVVFSPDGQYLVTSSDKLVQVWTFQQLPLIQTPELIAELCTRLTRNLTEAEWALYLETEPYGDTCPKLSDDPNAPKL